LWIARSSVKKPPERISNFRTVHSLKKKRIRTNFWFSAHA